MSRRLTSGQTPEAVLAAEVARLRREVEDLKGTVLARLQKEIADLHARVDGLEP